MKKLFLVYSVVCLVSSYVFASPFDKFNYVLNNATDSQAQRYLDNLASDMGALMTSGNYGVSASLGLANVNLNLKLNSTNVSNEIMRAEGTSTLYMPILYASVGLPYGIDILAKYTYFYDSNLYGLGARYALYESSVMIIPSVSVQGIYSMMKTSSSGNKLDTDNIALGAVATFSIPFVTPYIGVGWDTTKLEAKSSDKEGMSGSASSMGYSAGVAVSILMINGNFGITYYDGVPNYTFGLSAGF